MTRPDVKVLHPGLRCSCGRQARVVRITSNVPGATPVDTFDCPCISRGLRRGR